MSLRAGSIDGDWGRAPETVAFIVAVRTFVAVQTSLVDRPTSMVYSSDISRL